MGFGIGIGDQDWGLGFLIGIGHWNLGLELGIENGDWDHESGLVIWILD